MFNSGIKIENLLSQIRDECDVAIKISDSSLLYFYNSVIIFLYRDYIKKLVSQEITVDEDGVTTCDINEEYIKSITFEGYPALEKVSKYFASITTRPVWYSSGKNEITIVNVNVNVNENEGEKGTLYYYEVPDIVEIITEMDMVPLPYDFCDIVKNKVLAELYNAANDDALSAKYFGFFNTRLEDFRMWLINNKNTFN